MNAAALLALAAAMCFAVALIVTQYGLRTMPSWRSPIYSIGSSALIALPAAALFVDPAGFDLEAALIFAGVGTVFPVTASILSVRSNERLGPAVTAAAGNVAPLFAVLGAVLFLDETLAAGQVAGLVLVVGGVTLLALRGGAGGRRWPVWVLLLPLGAALVRGVVQPMIKSGLALWPEPMAAAAISYTMSTLVILSLAGGRALREGPAPRSGVLWFTAVGVLNGTATFLLYAALGLGSVALVAPLVAIFPLFATLLSYLLLRNERLHAAGLAGIAVSVGGVVLLLVGG